jgi:hypothetical protein
MTNLSFFKWIGTQIFKSTNNSKYYVRIPFISYDSEKSYLENYNNAIFVQLTNELIANDDIEEFIQNLDERYEYIYIDDISGDNLDSLTKIYSSNYSYLANLNSIIDINIDEEDVKTANQTFMNILKQTYTYNNL